MGQQKYNIFIPYGWADNQPLPIAGIVHGLYKSSMAKEFGGGAL